MVLPIFKRFAKKRFSPYLVGLLHHADARIGECDLGVVVFRYIGCQPKMLAGSVKISLIAQKDRIGILNLMVFW